MADSETSTSERPRSSPREVARDAGLEYVDGSEPGIRRRRCGNGFTYLDDDGETIREGSVRQRIEELAIPPAWSDVWICPSPDGHIQATGRDAEGRKQYVYHPRWKEAGDLRKFDHLRSFGESLPAVRQRVGRDLAREGFPRAKIVAVAVRLLDVAAMRIGNEQYAEENGSFGLITLRRRHVTENGGGLRFRFPGKGGGERDVEVHEPRVASIVRSLVELPSDRVLAWPNGDALRPLRSDDVNDYLRSVTGRDVTAKDFRTWRGSLRALEVLADAEPGDSVDDPHQVVLAAVDEVADLLGNERGTAREFYIQPGLLEAYEKGELHAIIEAVEERRLELSRPGFRRGEPLLLALLPALEKYLRVDRA